MKTSTLVLAMAIVVGLVAIPRAGASEFDKKTNVTFHQSMEIPGMVLPAGDYVIKRADRSLPDVVRFTNRREDHVYATVFALPTYRPVPTSDVVIITEERASNQPEAIKKWFYPGDTVGAEFVYPKRGPLMAMNTTPAFSESSSSYSAPAPAKTETVTPEPAPVKGEPMSQAEPARQTEVEVAQSNMPQSTTTTTTQTARQPEPAAQEELPKTASELPWYSLFGLLCVLGGLGLRTFSKRLS